MKCGLLGEKLGHSLSPAIHEMIDRLMRENHCKSSVCSGTGSAMPGDIYSYEMFERSPDRLEAFFTERDFDGINVTIPYKKSAMAYCDFISETAYAIGSVNVIVKKYGEEPQNESMHVISCPFAGQNCTEYEGQKPCKAKYSGPVQMNTNGCLYGYDTDAYGFERTLAHSGADVQVNINGPLYGYNTDAYGFERHLAHSGADVQVNINGSLYGYNTDAYGFERHLAHSGADVQGKKVAVLGTGGAALSVGYVLENLGAGDIIFLSRNAEKYRRKLSWTRGRPDIIFLSRGTEKYTSGKNKNGCVSEKNKYLSDAGTAPAKREIITAENVCSYGDIYKYSDADIVVNATPAGMFPDISGCPVDLNVFTKCSHVLDLIYNPKKTRLLEKAGNLGMQNENGLYMLIAQAVKSFELFTGRQVYENLTDDIYKILQEN